METSASDHAYFGTRWEATGAEEYKGPLRTAYFAVLDAWRLAAAEYGISQEAQR